MNVKRGRKLMGVVMILLDAKAISLETYKHHVLKNKGCVKVGINNLLIQQYFLTHLDDVFHAFDDFLCSCIDYQIIMLCSCIDYQIIVSTDSVML